jgi:hypothetical protein
MPGNLTYSGARYPLNTESDTVPADLLRFGTDIDQLLVLKAVSVSDRDAKFANVTAGTLVSCAPLGIVWQKKADGSAGGWRALATIGPVVTSGIATAASNFTVTKQTAQVVNGSIYVNVQANYTGPDIVANPDTETVPSNIIDIPFCTLDASWMPNAAFLPLPGYFRGIYVGGTFELRADNQVWLTTFYTSAKLRSGDPGGFATSWPVP